MAKSNDSGLAYAISLLIAFLAGSGLIFVFLYLPQQKIINQQQAQLSKWAEFNQQEQKRVSEIRNISENQLKEWVNSNNEANRQFLNIYNLLNEQKLAYSNSERYWAVLSLIILGVLIAFYIWLHRNENQKDIATLENFEIFIEQRLQGSAANIASRDIKVSLEGSRQEEGPLLPKGEGS